MEIIYQNHRGRPPLAYCCHLVLVVGCSDLFPHLDAQRKDQFPTAPALHDPAVPSPVKCPPPGMHGSPPSEHSQCPNISPSIQPLLDLPAGLCFCFPISRIHVLNGAGDTPGPSAGTNHQVSAIPASVPLETSDMDISTASTDRPSQVDPTPAITMGIQPSPHHYRHSPCTRTSRCWYSGIRATRCCNG